MIPVTLPSVASLTDPDDDRDFLFEWNPLAIVPAELDRRGEEAPVENQLSYGTCVDNAVVGADEAYLKANDTFVDLSRMFNAYNGRAMLGPEYLLSDLGSTLRMGLRANNKYGICRETTYPYVGANLNKLPPPEAYFEALQCRLGRYERIPVFGDAHTTPDMTTQTAIQAIKYALAKGYEVVGSFQVGAKIRTLQKGEVYLPVSSDNPAIGGHAIKFSGYANIAGNLVFIMRNSWGADYCDGGYFLMSTSVVTANTIDLWVVKGFAGFSTVGPDLTVEEPLPPLSQPAPTSGSTVKEIVSYVFLTKFGRSPKQAGLDFWAQATLDYMQQQIVAAASPADKAYMDAHP